MIYSRNVQLLFSFKTMFIVQVRVPICSKRYIEEIENLKKGVLIVFKDSSNSLIVDVMVLFEHLSTAFHGCRK